MARPLRELKALSLKHGGIPVLCAGDIFDRWNPTPELINFALEELPDGMFCIPGQHDLPYHRYEDIKKSGYWTLVVSGKVCNVTPNCPVATSLGLRVHGYPWGFPPTCLETPHDLLIEVALIHKYLWITGHNYPGAPGENRLGRTRKSLGGYDVAIFGDNHQGFMVLGKENKCGIINNGTFLRRKTDEKDYQPFLGLIYTDGSIDRHYLDTSKDILNEESSLKDVSCIDTKEFLEELLKLGDASLNFADTVRNYLESKGMSDSVRKIILQALEEKG